MVAISLYRGNLHRVPDTPRQWPMPPPAISLRHFKLLIHNRSQALSRLPARNPNPENNNKEEQKGKEEGMGDNGCPKPGPTQLPEPETALVPPRPNNREDAKVGEPLQESKGTDASAANPEAAASAVSKESRGSDIGGCGNADAKMEVSNKLDTVTDKEKRKRELEKKLHVLNEKKHHLVLMLKQILNAEEEIKKRSTQSSVLCPSIQAETAVDTGSVTRHVPKLSVDVNFGGHLGGESDAIANHNTHARQLYHMHSTSPSAASLTRPLHGPFQQNVVLPTPRASVVSVGHGQNPSNMMVGSGAAAAAASPSCFAPTGTHFVVSSPSPAASGGASSVFRDSHLTSSS